MQYLEHPDGEAVDDWLAAGIQEYARSIWVDFSEQGIAPIKWCDALRSMKDKFCKAPEGLEGST